MKKEIKVLNNETKTVRITTVDERWYAREGTNPVTGLPEINFRPSASWISSKYPKGIGYFKWLAEKGWDEAEAIKLARAESGSKVHQACELIALGENVAIDQKFKNPESEHEEELTVEEYEAVISFRQAMDSIKHLNPKVIKTEFLIWADTYAGTADLLIEVDKEEGEGREIWLIDLKTSQNIFDSHTVQLNAYFHAPIVIDEKTIVPNRMFILQVGYRKNKNAWKLTEVVDDMGKFQIAYQIWKYDHDGEAPKQRDLPLMIEGISDEKVEISEVDGDASDKKVAKKPKK